MLNYQRVYCIIMFYPRKQWSALPGVLIRRFASAQMLISWTKRSSGEKLWRFLWSLGCFKGKITGNPGNFMVKTHGFPVFRFSPTNQSSQMWDFNMVNQSKVEDLPRSSPDLSKYWYTNPRNQSNGDEDQNLGFFNNNNNDNDLGS